MKASKSIDYLMSGFSTLTFVANRSKRQLNKEGAFAPCVLNHAV
jgi:hypothetical protein